jgi:hypothetical protein
VTAQNLNLFEAPVRQVSIGFVLALMTWSSLENMAVAQDQRSPANSVSASNTDLVGRWRDDAIVTPVNQLLTPYGLQVDLPGMRPQALALSPDGQVLAVAGKSNDLVILDPVTGEIKARVQLPSEGTQEPAADVVSPNILVPDKSGQVSYTGLKFTHAGQRIYMSNVNGCRVNLLDGPLH